MIRKLTFLLLLILSVNFVYSQTGIIKGTIKSKENDEPLTGASIQIVGTKMGAVSDAKGTFEIKDIPPGLYTIKASYVGYNPETKEVAVREKQAAVLELFLTEFYIESEAINVVASRAEFRETPVAFSNIAREEITMRLGAAEIPMILNETPGVYATESGGGSGDSRINIRGFDQRNVAVMINGVPVNDMETGWVYWSNWDGIRDVTSSIQVQRGLGASRIANPSVGGTMNIVTDAARQKAGVSLKQDFGSGALLKSTIVANSGNINGLAVTFMGSRKTQDGLVQKTWSNDWSYYFALSFDASRDHKLDFYLIGSPQEHGQRGFRQLIPVYDHETARTLGVPESVISETTERGILYNTHWGPTKYKTKEYYNGSTHDPYEEGYLTERSNYYHKPQMNLNWFWRISDIASLTNVFYVSIGSGGGSSRVGPSIVQDLDGFLNFDRTIERNMNFIDTKYLTDKNRSETILRNAVNNHFWTGWLSTLDVKLDKTLRFQGGLDVRYYVGEHYQEVRNLLGGDYYVETIRNSTGEFVDSTGNLNEVGDKEKWVKYLGDKISYYYDGLINWLGAFGQLEYKEDALTTYLNLSLSNTGYKRKDYFRSPESINGNETDWQRFFGFTVKTGANYNISNSINIYGNVGYYSRPPMFNVVFNYDNGLFLNPLNEKVIAIELGTGYWTREFQANLNLYYTNWKDRSFYRSSRDSNDNFIYYNISGIDALHLGAELELTYKPYKFLTIKGMAALGDWRWTNNVSADVYDEGNRFIEKVNIYSDGLKVGNAAQSSLSLGGTVYPVDNGFLNITYKYFLNNYADYDPGTRTFEKDKSQSWEMPNYGLLEAHIGYTLQFEEIGIPFFKEMGIKAHFLNILDEKYIADAEDNRNNYYKDENKLPLHTARAAEVWFGLPFRWSLSVELNF